MQGGIWKSRGAAGWAPHIVPRHTPHTVASRLTAAPDRGQAPERRACAAASPPSSSAIAARRRPAARARYVRSTRRTRGLWHRRARAAAPGRAPPCRSPAA
eukprot:scaffold33013_cov112-Isochrysis_galbana.AAC.3